jgi:hypothetical protein
MIKTLAVKITEETYPIAIACLPPGFASTNKKCVLGSYLVINDLQFPEISFDGRQVQSVQEEMDDDECAPAFSVSRTRYGRLHGRHSGLTLTNYWEPAKLFKKKFKKVTKPHNDTDFFEITRK